MDVRMREPRSGSRSRLSFGGLLGWGLFGAGLGVNIMADAAGYVDLYVEGASGEGLKLLDQATQGCRLWMDKTLRALLISGTDEVYLMGHVFLDRCCFYFFNLGTRFKGIIDGNYSFRAPVIFLGLQFSNARTLTTSVSHCFTSASHSKFNIFSSHCNFDHKASKLNFHSPTYPYAANFNVYAIINQCRPTKFCFAILQAELLLD